MPSGSSASSATTSSALRVFGYWDDPYLTMSYGYQAAIVRALGRFVEQDMVYKGKKPVHWCIHCRTALAEAEVEYEPHKSPSIFVEFPLADTGAAALAARLPALAGRQVSALIWTTTPWTIPSNLALAFHPDFEYGAYNVGDRVVFVATGLASQVVAAIGRTLGDPVVTVKGADLEGLTFAHPLYGRPSVAVLGDYVTLEQGTGVVHTAPGHGADDFHTGVKYGLDIYAPVDAGGHFTEDVALFAGIKVFDANPRIEAALAERGRLWHRRVVRAQLSALLAVPSSGDLPGDGPVVHCHGTRQPPPAGARRRAGGHAGSRPGAPSASPTCWRGAPTGASRASAPGGCPSPRSIARSAAKP